MKNRFFSSSALETGEHVSLEGDELHHALRVARLREREEVEIFNASGRAVVARVDSLSRNGVDLVVSRELGVLRESPLAIRLCVALIQPEKFELVLQKATELGVARLTPLLTQRTEIRGDRADSKTSRWERIIFEAVKQSGRTRIPPLDRPMDFAAALAIDGPKILLEGEDEETANSAGIHDSVALFIGPEGGWSPEEISAARAIGFAIRSLGPRRLRAETAAIAAVTAISLEFGDLAPRRG